MYLWRHKNRRDRRDNLFEGVHSWINKSSSAKQDFADDCILREQKEEMHIKYFFDRVRSKMHEYLGTDDGRHEIALVIKEIEKNDDLKKQMADTGEITQEEAEEDRKATIYEIFRKFDADGGGTIDQDEFKVLLDELKIKLTSEEFEILFSSLDGDGGGEVDFEEFYQWFRAESEKTEPKTRWEKFLKSLKPAVFDNFKRLVMETEARNSLMDYCVNRCVENARREFRIVHPPAFLCKICNTSFVDKVAYDAHTDKAMMKKNHRLFFKQQKKDERRFYFVGNVFLGTQGRNLLARRVIFSPELAMSDDRINVAIEEKYRPSLSDPTGKRKTQMDMGMLVQGHDPSVGVRPQHSHLNLIRQYRAPGKKKEQPFLEDICMDLVHCQDLKIDVVQAPLTSAHAEVRIYWTGFSSTNIQIQGDFNGWKLQEMWPDRMVGKCCYKEMLPPGKYKFQFLLDGKLQTDPNQSTIEDPERGKCNVIMIINPTINREKSILPTIGYNPKDCLSEGTLTDRSNDSDTLAIENGGSPESKRSSNSPTSKALVEQKPKKPHKADVLSKSAVIKLDHTKILESLRHINMRNLSLHDDGAWAFAQFIKFNSTIEILDLSYNGISDDGMMALSACFPDLPCMHSLLLNGNGFGSTSAKHLGHRLKGSTCIKRIELSNNNLCDDGAEYIAEFLTCQESVEAIFLDSCFISDFGMEFIANMLVHNRRLAKLSIQNNRITTKSAIRLAEVLIQNATLLDLDISRNILGPEGTKAFGNMLYENSYITALNLSYTEAARRGSTMGIHALSYSLEERNKSLQYLKLGFNGLGETHMFEIAKMMITNIYLTEVELEGNPINNQWYLPDTHIETRSIESLPTLRTSLDRNKLNRADPSKAIFYEPCKPEIVVDHPDGYWTIRRRWKRVNRKSEEKRALKEALGEEMKKIKLEESYVRDKVAMYIDTVQYFLDDTQSQPFLKVLAGMIAEHYHNVVKINPNENDSELALLQSPLYEGGGGSGDKLHPMSSDGKLNTLSALNSQKDGVFKTRAELIEERRREEEERIKAQKAEAERVRRIREEFIDFYDESFDQMHVALLGSMFKSAGADKDSLLIHPELLERVLLNLCLPLSQEDLQQVVENSLMNWKCSKCGFKKFCIYVKKIAYHAAKKKKFLRMRYISDLFFHPPFYEAKKLILDSMTYQQIVIARKEYRHMQGKAPLFMCYYCGKRFPTEKAYEKHMAAGNDGYEHKRFHMHLAVYQAQRVVLRKAKYLFTKTYFPSFWELVPEKKLPLDYSPQVFDKVGDEGRPIGVITFDRTIRVEDMLGDYVQIAYDGRRGWTRYKMGSYQILQSACSNIPGFTWDHLKIFETPRYYRVSTDLVADTEVKVRYMPRVDADAEVLGHLVPGDVVECRAVLGDWLQIVYKLEAAAWVVSVTHAGEHSIFATDFPKDEVLTPRTAAMRKADKVYQKAKKRKEESYKGPKKIIELLPIPLQKKFGHIVNKSPYKPSAEDMHFSVEYDSSGFRVDTSMDEEADEREVDEMLADPTENWFSRFIV